MSNARGDSDPSPTKTSNPHPSTSATLHRIVTRSQNNIYKSQRIFDDTAHVTSEIPPQIFKQADKLPRWKQAIKIEFDTLMKNQTWVLVPPNQSNNVVSRRWLYMINK